jgi:hypothetical protein
MHEPDTLTGRLIRSADAAARGIDVEHYLDQLAVEAFVRLYPAEVPDLADVYGRGWSRARMPEHMVDAFALAIAEADERRESAP